LEILSAFFTRFQCWISFCIQQEFSCEKACVNNNLSVTIMTATTTTG
jgi:hypothetical protein